MPEAKVPKHSGLLTRRRCGRGPHDVLVAERTRLADEAEASWRRQRELLEK
jgi:hypothetical protein